MFDANFKLGGENGGDGNIKNSIQQFLRDI